VRGAGARRPSGRARRAILPLLPVCCGIALATADPSDRLSLTANADTLSGTSGGAGVALAWLHNFAADTLAGISVIGDYADLAGSRRAMLTVNYMRHLGSAAGAP
jgi:hypothetical protein